MGKVVECACGVPVKVSDEAIAATCSECVVEGWTPLKAVVKKKEGYPRGWSLLDVFVHVDGSVYYKGIEQPKLKGKRKPTPIKKKVKLTKKEKMEKKQALINEYAALKKEFKVVTSKVARNKIEKRLNKLSKLIK